MKNRCTYCTLSKYKVAQVNLKAFSIKLNQSNTNEFRDIFGKKTKKSFFSVISHLLDGYEKEDLISAEEKKMFKNIASFGDKRVAAVMTPRSDIIAIKQGASLEEVKELITTDGHTRIPVFKENFDVF